MNIGPTELVLLLIIALMPLTLVACVVGIVDAARRSDADFEAVGQSRVTWIILQVVALVACPTFGVLLAGYYLLAIRPKVKAGARPDVHPDPAV